MFVARFRGLERGGHVKDGFTVLDSRHPASAEAIAVAQHFNIVNDGFLAIAGTQEVTMKGVNQAFLRHGFFGGIQRLTDHLAAEDLT